MDATLKWLGGATLGAVLTMAGLAIAGSAFAGKAADRQGANAGPAQSAPLPPTPTPIASRLIAMSEPGAVGGNAVSGAPAGQAATATASGSPETDSEPLRAAADKPEAEQAPATTPLVIKRILPIEGPMKYGEWHWNTEGAPKDGKLVITIDLEARVMSVFLDGYEIGAAVTYIGIPGHDTPTGTFPILSKERHNVSEKYANAPMPWTLRLTRGGIAIHGGNDVENGFGSHGCLGVPDPFASRLFAIAKKGDLVIVTKGRHAGLGDSLT